MKKKCIILLFVSLGACANQPRNVKINSNYEYGFSVSETPEMVNELKKIGDFCIKLDPNIEQIQPMMRKGGDSYYHIFSVRELVEILNQLNGCSKTDKTITLIELNSEINYFERMRYNGYTVLIKILGNSECSGMHHELRVESSSGLENNSFIGDKKINALIASALVLAFHKAISKTYDKIAFYCP